MNIVFMTYDLLDGGADRVITTLANALVNENHDVSIVMVSSTKKESYFELNKNVSLVPLLYGLEKKPSILKKAKLIRKTILDIKPDVVVSFISFVCIYTWFALRGTKIPYIVSERNDPNQREHLKQFLLNKAFKYANGCVFQTHDAFNWYKKYIKGDSAIIYNPVNLTYIPSEHKIIERENAIVSVGRLSSQKNQKFIIDAFCHFSNDNPGFILKLYGDGQDKKMISDYIKTNNLNNVILLGSNKNWHKEVFNAKLFVLGSKFEGMPNALEEALCLGLPCVSTDCSIGGPKELKKLFPNRLSLSTFDVVDFAKQMENLLKKSEYGVFIPDELKIENITNQWVSFIKKVIEK